MKRVLTWLAVLTLALPTAAGSLTGASQDQDLKEENIELLEQLILDRMGDRIDRSTPATAFTMDGVSKATMSEVVEDYVEEVPDQRQLYTLLSKGAPEAGARVNPGYISHKEDAGGPGSCEEMIVMTEAPTGEAVQVTSFISGEGIGEKRHWDLLTGERAITEYSGTASWTWRPTEHEFAICWDSGGFLSAFFGGGGATISLEDTAPVQDPNRTSECTSEVLDAREIAPVRGEISPIWHADVWCITLTGTYRFGVDTINEDSAGDMWACLSTTPKIEGCFDHADDEQTCSHSISTGRCPYETGVAPPGGYYLLVGGWSRPGDPWPLEYELFATTGGYYASVALVGDNTPQHPSL